MAIGRHFPDAAADLTTRQIGNDRCHLMSGRSDLKKGVIDTGPKRRTRLRWSELGKCRSASVLHYRSRRGVYGDAFGRPFCRTQLDSFFRKVLERKTIAIFVPSVWAKGE